MRLLKQIEVDKKQKQVKNFFEIKIGEIESKKNYVHYRNGWICFGNTVRFNSHNHDRFINGKIIKREKLTPKFSYKDILFYPVKIFKNL